MAEDHSTMGVNKDERKLALVIVDLQKKFILGAGDATLDSAKAHMQSMNRVIDMFRAAGRPVIWILYEGPTHMEGITMDLYALLDGFKMEESDHVVIKYHMNSFNNTNLSDMIHALDCDSALLMGMFAQHCVMSTYWGAYDKGVSPYMMKDCLISNEEKYCDLIYGLCKTYDFDELESNLKANAKK